MAISTYNVTSSDVLDEIPLDTRQVQQSSGKVSKDQIDSWIKDYASIYSGALEKAGLQPGDLSGEAEAQIQKGIVAGVAAKAMQVWGHTGSAYQQLKDEHDQTLARYEEDPQRLDKTVSRYESNADTTVDESSYKGVNWNGM